MHSLKLPAIVQAHHYGCSNFKWKCKLQWLYSQNCGETNALVWSVPFLAQKQSCVNSMTNTPTAQQTLTKLRAKTKLLQWFKIQQARKLNNGNDGAQFLELHHTNILYLSTKINGCQQLHGIWILYAYWSFHLYHRRHVLTIQTKVNVFISSSWTTS